jgi:C4-dicarboxylate-specific signal transduction histidine kinase
LPKQYPKVSFVDQLSDKIHLNAVEDEPKGQACSFLKLGIYELIYSVHIQDTGTGIPEEIRNKIFEAFFTTKQKVKGVGLGFRSVMELLRIMVGTSK